MTYLYDLPGRYREAESLYLQALPILSAQLEENHIWRQEAAKNWRSFLQKAIQEKGEAAIAKIDLTMTIAAPS